MQFARWYFERQGEDIEVIPVDPLSLHLPDGRSWDFVFSDSVIEHLIEPAGTVETLARAVRMGGVLYLIIDAHNVGDAYPMHRHIEIDDLLKRCPTLARMQHVKRKGDVVNVFRRVD